MLIIRKRLLLLSLILGGGSLSSSLAYGLYLRSSFHRQAITDKVESFLNLPIDIGAIKPLTTQSLLLSDIHTHLPQRREEIFTCEEATWTCTPRDDCTLQLVNGALTIVESRWRAPDYRRVLEAGLAHDFSTLPLRQVLLSNMDVRMLQDNWQVAIEQATGTVALALEDHTGQAQLTSKQINGHPTVEPITCVAQFRTMDTLTMNQVSLTVPKIPIEYLNLDTLVGSTISKGYFSGTIVYAGVQHDSATTTLSGTLEDLILAEFTPLLSHGPITGRIKQAQLSGATLVSGQLEKAELAGELEDIDLATVSPYLEGVALGGRLDLTVDRVVLRGTKIEHLVARGNADGIGLADLLASLGLGKISGTLELSIISLEISDNEIAAGELEARVIPPVDSLPLIDRLLVEQMAAVTLGTDVGALPFDEIEYGRLGCRVSVKNGKMTIRGLYGPNSKTILTVKLLGREIPVLKASKKTVDLSGLLDRLGEAVQALTVPSPPDRQPIEPIPPTQ